MNLTLRSHALMCLAILALLTSAATARAADAIQLSQATESPRAQALVASAKDLLLPEDASNLPEDLFELNNEDSLSLDALQGTVVLIDFWASWCDPCKQSFPWMKEMQERYADQGFVILAINVDRKDKKARRFLAEQAVNFPVVFDAKGVNASRNQLKAMPTSLLLDRQGRVRLRHQGFHPETAGQLEACITQLLLEEPAE